VNVITVDRPRVAFAEATSIYWSWEYRLLVMGVPLVLVAIPSAVVVSTDFNQAYSGKKENDRGMDV